MNKNQKKPNVQTVVHSCVWCQQTIPEDSEIFGLGVKAKPDFDLTPHEGNVMSLYCETMAKEYWGIVPTADSDARKHGYDLLFSLCSEDCAAELKVMLKNEIELGNILESIQHNPASTH